VSSSDERQVADLQLGCVLAAGAHSPAAARTGACAMKLWSSDSMRWSTTTSGPAPP